MLNYNSKLEIKKFLEERGIGMRKKYGQNFMVDPNVRRKLLDALELRSGNKVWEIGPGLGAMTTGLLERGAEVTAFEIDPAFAGIIRGLFTGEELACTFTPGAKFTCVEGDVLRTWTSVVSGEGLFLFGNLPYNIAAALLADFIEKGRFFTRIVVTVQREVARRMYARPGSSDYSSFSVLCSSVYKVSPLFTIKPSSFYPEPRVDSQGVKLDLLPCRPARSVLFFPLVRSLFSSRRKTLRNSLSNFVSSVIIKKTEVNRRLKQVSLGDEVELVLGQASINGERRAETLEADEFNALALGVEELISHGN